MTNYPEEFIYDLGLLASSLTRKQAEEVYTWLSQNGLLDYDALKEFYDEED